METLPIELLRGTNLIRKTEVIGPPLLLGAPTTAPSELEHVRRALRSSLDSSHEVRTP